MNAPRSVPGPRLRQSACAHLRSRFVGWITGKDAGYLHPFTAPAGWERESLAPYWLEAPDAGSFAEDLCPQSGPSLAGLAPKQITTPEYAGILNYAYHLDAGKLGALLQRHCVERLGVVHRLEEIVRVESSEDGDIRAVHMLSGVRIEADLFIDCTGLASLLIGKHFGTPLISRRDVLFVDRAWAAQVPHAEPEAPIASLTVSTAQSAGWVWDIALPGRRGIGHAYASGYLDDDTALAQLRGYLRERGLPEEAANARRIDVSPGYRREFWVRNCVAVGLSAGFLEPLEASAIVMVELSAQMIGNLLPRRRSAMDNAARVFNQAFRYRWERVVEFLKLHYVLSRREDSDFWRDNRRPESVPADLAARLQFWQSQSPWQEEFLHREEVFSAASYQYVLYGMGFVSSLPSWTLNEGSRTYAREQMRAMRERNRELCAALPPHRELLERISRYGLQRI